jgi:hypothetical protein
VTTGETSLLAIGTALGVFALGWFLLHNIRNGFDYISSRGNPRNRAQAHEAIRDTLIGAAIIAACIGTGAGAFIFGLIKF